MTTKELARQILDSLPRCAVCGKPAKTVADGENRDPVRCADHPIPMSFNYDAPWRAAAELAERVLA
jgi:hypothetical protein